MSHFVVFVIGEDIDGQLAPYSESNEDYFEFEDTTDELQKEYNEGSVEVCTRPDGSWFFAHCQESDKKGTLKTSRCFKDLFPTLEDFCREWHSLTPNYEGRYGTSHNPDARWDWYIIGGRWAGMLKAKQGVIGVLGDKEPGTSVCPGYYDQLTKGDMDLEGMRADARRKAIEFYDRYEAVTAGIERPKLWEEFQKDYITIGDARTAIQAHPYTLALKAAKMLPFLEDPIAFYEIGREKFIQRAEFASFVPHAVLYNNEWFSIGRMGWFGQSEKDMSLDEWNDQVLKIIQMIPDNTLITVIDCHI